jgi:uncharacterized RDD family membrane protein YckC
VTDQIGPVAVRCEPPGYRAVVSSDPADETADGAPAARPAAAGLWLRRAVALLLDWVISILIARTLLPFDSSPGTLLVFALEQVLLVGTIGFSLGHRLLGLRVVRAGGGPAGPGAALIRTALLLLVVPAVLTDGQGVGLHDRAAGTRIVRLVPIRD